MIKCELVVDGYLYRVTDDVANWDDVVLSVKRGDYDGVVRSFTSKFEFVNGAHALLKKQYRDNYLRAAASVIISRRNNSWKWNELFRCTLDFSTYEDSGNAISINAVDDSLASLIKAKRGTQYEYSVDVIKEEKQLNYDRIEKENTSKSIITGDTVDVNGVSCVENVFKGSGSQTTYSFPIYISGTQEISIKDLIEIYDVGKRVIDGFDYDGKFFLKNISGSNVSVNIKLNLELYAEFTGEGTPNIRIDNHDKVFFYQAINNGVNSVNLDDDFVIPPNGFMCFGIMTTTKDVKIYQKMPEASNEFLQISFIGKEKPVLIDVVSPLKLLNRLLQSMNGGKEGISGEINGGLVPYKRIYDIPIVIGAIIDNSMIVAAESVRGIKNAKLYSSFSKFCDWMKATFGYVYGISGNKVIFMHRTKCFSNEVVKDVQSFDDFSHSVNSSLIYSRVRVGYEKQDYDSINGRDEFRFTNTFSTGQMLTDNSLELISPYRADAYGIEFLVQKRGEDTTDTNSDNDVFFVGAKLNQSGLAYELIRGGRYVISGVISPDSMFNAMYSPRQMLLANKGIIGCCTERLTYTSGEGNSDVVIGGVSEKDDVVISKDERITTVGELSFSTPEFEIPDNQNGLVSLTRNGEKYVGYIQKAGMNVGREECTKFTLSVKRIE